MTPIDQFLQMTFVSSRVDDYAGVLHRFETRKDDLTGLTLTRRFPIPVVDIPLQPFNANRRSR